MDFDLYHIIAGSLDSDIVIEIGHGRFWENAWALL